MRKILWCVFLVFSSPAWGETLDLDKIIVDASRSGTSVLDINKDVEVITSQEISKRPSLSLSELLGTMPGVNGIQFGNIKSSSVGLRASGEASASNVLVLIDGRRTNQIDLSGTDWSQVDTQAIERIEIIKGSGTVLYGDNASSGVINIITKKGRKNTKPLVSTTHEAGSYQTQKHAIDVSGGFKHMDYRFNFINNQTSGYRANSNYRASDYTARLGFDPTDILRIDVNTGHHIDRYQLPGALFQNNIDQIGRRGVRSSLNDDNGRTADTHVDMTPRLKFSSGTSTGEFSLFTSHRRRYNEFLTGQGVNVYESKYLINSYEAQPKLVLNTPLHDDLDNTLTGGYDYFYGKNIRHSGNLFSGGFSYPQDKVHITKSTHGLYLLDEVQWNKWLFNAGTRRIWSDYVFDQKEVLSTKSSSHPQAQGYEAGLGYKYNDASKVYVQLARSVRLPAVDEFFSNIYPGGPQDGLNPDLTYQVGHEVAWGIKDKSIRGVSLGANFFVSQYKKEIYYDPTGGPSGFGANSNYNDRALHYGVNTDSSVLLLDGKIEPFVNVGIERARFQGGKYDGKSLPFVADHVVHAGVSVYPIERLSSTLSVDQVGESFGINDDRNEKSKLKSHLTTDWSIKYRLKNVEMWFAINNITNVRYSAYEALSGSGLEGYYPSPGRNAKAGIKMQF